MDLSLEAEHLWQFNLNFRKHAAVRFPVPIYPLVAPEVLVETFQEGDSISRCCSQAYFCYISMYLCGDGMGLGLSLSLGVAPGWGWALSLSLRLRPFDYCFQKGC